MNSIWQFINYDEQLAQTISRAANISLIAARLLVQRGITSPEEARCFLYPDLKLLTDPMMMNGMRIAVDRILSALEKQEKIIVYGDYDADGVCSVAILVECLQKLGHRVDYYVPNRFDEGYGLNKEAIEELTGLGYKLIITVDCGISSLEEARLAKQLGIDLIITDHHTPPAVLPEAMAVINPKNDKISALTNLAGVGVAYKLACALLQARGAEVGLDWLDLVALATVADIVPLLEENRILVKYGLEALEKTKRPGLQALMQKTNLVGKKLQAWHIGFVLAPRLNSAGRLNSARRSIELLLTQDADEAEQLAAQLCSWNDERRSIEESIYQQAILEVESNTAYANDLLTVTGGEGWHEGVIGIVASRLAQHYNRPAIVISWDGDKGRGSARSAGEVDLYAALTHCQDCLEQFGGHKMAAGLSLKKDKLAVFQQTLLGYMDAGEAGRINLKKYRADLEIDPTAIDTNLWNEISLLSPFGEGNPMPYFVMRASNIHEPLLVGGQGEHFKCKTGSNLLEAIAFNRPDIMGPNLHTCKQDLLCELSENTFKGRTSLQLKIKDMKNAFYPDYPHEAENNTVQLVHVFQRTLDEIAAGCPVLFVYPGCRTLSKHLPLLHGIFKAEQVQELHGLLAVNHRAHTRNQFNQGENKLFLTTQAYLDYYCQQYGLPNTLHYAVAFWSAEQRQAFAAPHVEIEKIGIKEPQLEMFSVEDHPPVGRTIVYANRPSTIRSISQSAPGALIESGLTEPSQRAAVRRRFVNGASEMLIIDGTHPSNLVQLGGIENFILADSPFGHHELSGAADYMDEIKIPLKISFPREDFKKNQRYLERIYPEWDQVQEVGQQLIRYGKDRIRAAEEQLAARLANDMKRDFRALDLLPILYILADLGLCQFQKSGSIIEIQLLKNSTAKLNILSSPYYLEGQREKSWLFGWEKSLNNNLVW